MYSLEYLSSKVAREEIIHFLNENNYETQLKSIEDFKVPIPMYKYSNISKHLLENLRNNNLTASSPVNFNDVYDSTMHFNTEEFDRKRINDLNENSIKLGLGEVINKEYKGVLLERAKEIDKFSLRPSFKKF